MNVWLAQHGAACRLALQRLAAAPLNTLLSLLAIGIALALPAGGQMLLANALTLARTAAPQPQVSVFLAVGADDKAVRTARDRLQRLAGVREVVHLPREETLARMKASGNLREVIDVLGRNPFPDAFILHPRDEGAEAMERLAAEARKLPAVEHVQLDSAWVRRLDALLQLGRSGVAALGLLLAVGLVAITFNVIRLQVVSIVAEIELSRLLGATEAFIRRPFLYYGSLLGSLGGLIAVLLVAAAASWLRAPLTELASLYGLDLTFSGLSAEAAIAVIALAGGLGFLGAGLSVRQHLSR